MLSLSKPSANCNLFASGESLKYWFTKMWHRDTNWANAVGNVETKDLLGAKTFNFFKKKMQYLWHAVTWGVPVPILIL